MNPELSVLIPVWNYDCRQLVEAMRRSCEAWGGTSEIVVCDDASTDTQLSLRNERGVRAAGARFVRNERNMGRARTRNLLADEARGTWMLVVDCDAAVPADFSIARYMAAAERADCVCGGLRHPSANPNPAATLRYRYERDADRRRAAAIRQRHPYDQLSTFNLLMRREVFMQVRFDEECREYGYEDALLGVELERRGVEVLHIDNPLVHCGLEANDVYLRKAEAALRTLRGLGGRMRGHSRVENAADRLRRWHVAWAARLAHRALGGLMRRNLLGAHPSLLVFSAYKLGYYLNLC